MLTIALGILVLVPCAISLIYMGTFVVKSALNDLDKYIQEVVDKR